MPTLSVVPPLPSTSSFLQYHCTDRTDAAAVQSQFAIATPHEQCVVAAYKRWVNLVVKITVHDRNNRGRVVSAGCGILWNDANYVVTNAHVVLHARHQFKASPSGRELRLVTIDRYHDIALLAFANDNHAASIARTMPTAPPVSENANGTNRKRNEDDDDAASIARTMPAAPSVSENALASNRKRNWRGAQDIQVGQTVLCVYYPYSFPISLTVGVVSGIEREIKLRGPDNPPLYDVVQFDAAVLPGASGSPLVNTAGELLGMTVAMATNKGIGLAIPYLVLESVVEHMIEFEKAPPIPCIRNGAHTVRSIDGWRIGVVDDVWRLLHRKYKVGDRVTVRDIDPNGDVESAIDGDLNGGGAGGEETAVITLEDRAASGMDNVENDDDMKRAKL